MKKLLQVSVLLYLLFLNSNFICCAQKKMPFVEKAEFIVKSDSEYICITNKGISSARIFFNINDKLFINNEEIAKKVKKLTGNEPGYFKAWTFLKTNTFHDDTISCKEWLHNPLIFINSVGYGYCDDRASVLAFIWKEMGYKSRVWNLEGHVVPEVFVNDRYEMYDPDYEVFYRNKDNNIMGVEEISKNAALVLEMPDEKTSLRSCVRGHAFDLRTLYETYENNKISEYYNKLSGPEEFALTMPAGSVIIIPVNLVTGKMMNLKLKQSAFMKLQVGFSGELCFPYVIRSVRGNGDVEYNGKSYKINGLFTFTGICYNDTIKVNSLKEEMIIEFYINPLSLITRDSIKAEVQYKSDKGIKIKIDLIENPGLKGSEIFWGGDDSVKCNCIGERANAVKNMNVISIENVNEKLVKYIEKPSCDNFSNDEGKMVVKLVNELFVFADSLKVRSAFFQNIKYEPSFLYNIEKLRQDSGFAITIKDRLLVVSKKKKEQ